MQKTGSRGTWPCLADEDDADPPDDEEDVDDDGSTEFLTFRLNTGRFRLGVFLLEDKEFTDGASLMKAS